MPPLTKFQKIQQRLKTNPLNVSKPVVTQPTIPPANNPAVSVFPKATNPKISQNFGMGSAEGGMVNPTVATSTNPVIKVNTPKTTVDYSTLDK